MHLEDPRFPPLLTGHGVKAPAVPFEIACRGAADGTYGAADVIYARNTRKAELALVLEPDVPRRQALHMLPLFELAAIEAVGALMPPKTSVLLRWPQTLLVNVGVAGRFRFAMSSCASDEIPDWMVVGVQIDLEHDDAEREPGLMRDRTTLHGEGGGELTRSDVLEVIGSYVLSWIDSWQEAGQTAAAFAESWIGRVEGHEAPAPMHLDGASGENVTAQVLGLDDEPQVLVKVAEGDVRALAFESLLEPATVASARMQSP